VDLALSIFFDRLTITKPLQSEERSASKGRVNGQAQADLVS
jgi:hypothetical protein